MQVAEGRELVTYATWVKQFGGGGADFAVNSVEEVVSSIYMLQVLYLVYYYGSIFFFGEVGFGYVFGFFGPHTGSIEGAVGVVLGGFMMVTRIHIPLGIANIYFMAV